MNTDKDLSTEFCNNINKLCKWQTKVLQSVNVDYVIGNLLKEKFVVEIEGHKYDITFGKNRKNYIETYMSIYPSPPLCSFEIINKGFALGKWYKVTEKDLPQKEIEEYIQDIKDKEERKYQEWVLDCAKRILKNKGIAIDNLSAEEIVSKI